MLAHRMMGPPLVQRGEPCAASEHLERVRQLYDPARDRGSAQVFGADLKASGLAFMSQAVWLQGYPDRALTWAREGLSDAEALPHAYTVSFAQLWVALVHFLRGEAGLAAEQALRAMELCQEFRFIQHLAYAKAHRGRALIDLGEAQEGVALLRVGLDDGAGMRIVLNRTLNLASLAAGAARLGDWDQAMERLDEAQAQVEASGERWYEPEIQRLRGEFSLAQHGLATAAEQAESCFHQSIALARRQGAKSWELRAASSLARLWQSQGKVEQAYDRLASIYNWFTEGFDTRDLKEAKVLLEGLSAGASPGVLAGQS
jgi:adenylate cyclase